MRSRFVFVLLFIGIVFCCPPLAAQVTENPDISYAPLHHDLIPSATHTYADRDDMTNRLFEDLSGDDAPGGGDVLSRPAALSKRFDRPAGLRGGRRYVPILLSALVPGAGEVYLGYYKRGIALMAIEAGAWTGYVYYHGKGLDTREEYEAYADRHWNVQKWADHHPDVYPFFTGFTPAQMDSVGRLTSGTGDWPGYIPWVSREEDKQHYYENIGKYDWYISGWEDFDPTVDPFPQDTDMRDEYRSLRKKSNDQLDNANIFVYLSIATRVFSIVETILLTRDGGGDEEQVDLSANTLQFKARARGYNGGEIALEYRFK